MKLQLSFFPAFFLLALTACVTPTSLDQQLAYAQTLDTSVLTASTSALRAGEITADEHEANIRTTDQAKALIDAARLTEGTDFSSAEQKLQLATKLLLQLQDNLAKHRGVK